MPSRSAICQAKRALAMKIEDKQRFAQALIKSALNYSKDLTKEHMALLWDDLADYDIDEVEQAIALQRQTGDFFPKVSDIIALIPSRKTNKLKPGQFLIEGGRKYRMLN